jgi:hypothetical protein
VAAPPESLEALVRDELRAPVAELVRRLVPELVAEQVNGGGPPTENPSRGGAAPNGATKASKGSPDYPPAPRARKTCASCGEVKDAIAFGGRRRVCRRCRGRQERERRNARTAAQANGDDEG